jgi:F-type H+-transporting ATPase subunit delta
MIDAARSIARSLLNEARAAGELEQANSDLSRLARVVADAEVRRFLGHPRIPPAEKEQALAPVIESGLVRRLLAALLAVRSIDMLPDIAESLTRLVRRETGFVETVARVAQSLSPAQEDRIRAAVKSATGLTPVMKVQVDPRLIGGVRLTIDGRVADNSLKSELERLKETLQAL